MSEVDGLIQRLREAIAQAEEDVLRVRLSVKDAKRLLYRLRKEVRLMSTASTSD